MVLCGLVHIFEVQQKYNLVNFQAGLGGGGVGGREIFLALLHGHFLVDFAEAEFMRFLGFLGIILRVLRLEVSVWILKP
jgi:hypothetical protein